MRPIEKILVKLFPSPYQNFQIESLKSAIDQKECLTNELLEYIERVAKNKNLTNKNHIKYIAFIQAIYILAQFREERSYPLIVKCLSQLHRDDFCNYEFDFGRVLASVCNGDISLIKSLIEGPTVKMIIRRKALLSIVTSYCNDQITRENLISYVQYLLNKKIEQENIDEYGKLEFFRWLIELSIGIYPRELRGDLDNFFKNNDYEYYKHLKRKMDHVLKIGEELTLIKLKSYQAYSFIDDAMAELYAIRSGYTVFWG